MRVVVDDDLARYSEQLDASREERHERKRFRRHELLVRDDVVTINPFTTVPGVLQG